MGKKPKIPKKVVVRKKEVSIIPSTKRKMGKINGYYYLKWRDENGNRVIEVNKDVCNKTLFNTLIHEYLHALIDIGRFKFSSVRKEERLVYAIADEITDLLIKNPELVGLLKKNKKIN